MGAGAEEMLAEREDRAETKSEFPRYLVCLGKDRQMRYMPLAEAKELRRLNPHVVITDLVLLENFSLGTDTDSSFEPIELSFTRGAD